MDEKHISLTEADIPIVISCVVMHATISGDVFVENIMLDHHRAAI